MSTQEETAESLFPVERTSQGLHSGTRTNLHDKVLLLVLKTQSIWGPRENILSSPALQFVGAEKEDDSTLWQYLTTQ